MKFLIYPNINKIKSRNIVEEIIDFSKKHNVEIFLPKDIAKHYNLMDFALENYDYYKIDIAISIGGDGTLLSLMRKCVKYDIPVCGINIGHLGFLADIEIEYIYESLLKLINKDYFITSRMMLLAKVVTQNEEFFVDSCVNDIVIAKAGVSRMIYVDVYINGHKFASYPSDGIIFSTPTGSTAYSLSAGGPIVSPKVAGYLVTPICPHNLSIRPILVDENEIISLKFSQDKSLESRDIKLTIDGQESVDINAKDEIFIYKSNLEVKLIRFEESKFYETLKSKLNIG